MKTVITDPKYKLEQFYKQNGIPYSPFLMHQPSHLLDEVEKNIKEDELGYYKTFILVDEYDESPEEVEQINRLIKINSDVNGEARAFTNWFDVNGDKSLRPCFCSSYNPVSKLYKIRILNGDKGEVRKEVTRYNILFESEQNADLERRKELAVRWKELAIKHYAVEKFVGNEKLDYHIIFIDETKAKEIAYLAYSYKGTSKLQYDPVAWEELDDAVRFGIYRRNSLKRQFDLENKSLASLLKCSHDMFSNFLLEFEANFEHSQKKNKFLYNLPYSLERFILLNSILPLKSFLTPAEKFLFPHEGKSFMEFPKEYNFLNSFKLVESKIHVSDKLSFDSIYQLNSDYFDKMDKRTFFRFNFRRRVVSKELFLDYAKNNVMNISREIKSAVLFCNEKLNQLISMKTEEVKRLNKGAE